MHQTQRFALTWPPGPVSVLGAEPRAGQGYALSIAASLEAAVSVQRSADRTGHRAAASATTASIPSVKPKATTEHVCTPRKILEGEAAGPSPEKGWARGGQPPTGRTERGGFPQQQQQQERKGRCLHFGLGVRHLNCGETCHFEPKM